MGRRILKAGRSAALVALALAISLAAGQAAAEGWSVGKLLGGKTVEGSGKMVTEERQVAAFDRIESDGPLDVDIRIGSPQKVTLTIDDNLAPLVSTEVHGNKLKIEIKKACRSDTPAKVEIVVPSLAGVASYGSGDITLGALAGGAFQYEIFGSGDLKADGKVEKLDVSIAGSGDVNAQDLQAGAVKVRIMGSGDAVVLAKESLDASIMGSGDVTCFGNPPRVEKHTFGSGEINMR